MTHVPRFRWFAASRASIWGSIVRRVRGDFVLAVGVLWLASTPLTAIAETCAGDCDDDGSVTVNEIVTLVRIALLLEDARACAAGDTDGDGRITVDEIVRAVRSVLAGCPPLGGGTPTPTPSATAFSPRTPTHTHTATPTASPRLGPVVQLGPCVGPGQTLVADISTGQGAGGPAVPDPFWRFLPPTPPIGAVPFTTAPHSAWAIPAAGSWWIQPSASGNPSPGPSARYAIQIAIAAPISQYTALRIVGQYAADNTVPSILLNGTLIGSCSPATSNCFAVLQPLNFVATTPPFPPFTGSDTLEFRVNNLSNVTGLLVRARVEADCAPATPTATFTPSRTPTRSASPSASFSATRTFTASPTWSFTRSPSPSATATPTRTPTGTATPSPTRTFSPTATPTCVPLPPGAVAWWPLDDPSGATSVLDIGGAAHHGTPLPAPVNSNFGNGPVTVAGRVGTALYFFSGNEVAAVPPSTAFDLATSSFTIDAWFAAFPPGTLSFGGIPNLSPGQTRHFAVVDKLDPNTNSGYAFALRTTAAPALPPNAPDGFLVSVTVDVCLWEGASAPACAGLFSGTLEWDAPTNSFLPLNPPWPYSGQWLHLAITVDRTANAGQFFLNGAPLGPVFSPATGTGNNALPLWLGKSRLPDNGFEFTLDEIEVFDRALAAAEIAALAGSGGKCKTPAPFTPTPSSTLTRTASATRTPSRTATLRPTITPTATVDGECRFVGPRMCGGTCPNPNEVCVPKPDDSGCHCVVVEPATPSPTPHCPAGIFCTATPTASGLPNGTSTPTQAATNTRTSTRTATRTPTYSPTTTPSPCFAEVCVTKFWDLNANGQNDGEPGLQGWTIQFFDASNTLSASVVTGPAGTTCAGIPAPGSYTVQEVSQGGCGQTFPPPPGTHSISLMCGQLVNLAFGNRCPPPSLTPTATPTRTPKVPPPD
ncbi:MAG: hypothetical protein KatS3mg077_1338 [Candidatus Binatia bacterium]|nr:MAG: hypothetical protein KatS3mg077_1338 [Candidatus Binatia bacterium]